MRDTAPPPKGRGLNSPSTQSTPREATLPDKRLLQKWNTSFYAIDGNKMTSRPFLCQQREQTVGERVQVQWGMLTFH